jgi:hypothetical protein
MLAYTRSEIESINDGRLSDRKDIRFNNLRLTSNLLGLFCCTPRFITSSASNFAILAALTFSSMMLKSKLMELSLDHTLTNFILVDLKDAVEV